MLVAWWVSMGKNRIRMDTDSDISDNHICVFFQFPSLRMETDRIRTDTDSDISDNHFPVRLPFPSLPAAHRTGGRLSAFTIQQILPQKPPRLSLINGRLITPVPSSPSPPLLLEG